MVVILLFSMNLTQIKNAKIIVLHLTSLFTVLIFILITKFLFLNTIEKKSITICAKNLLPHHSIIKIIAIIKKLGKKIQGYPVLGVLDDLKDLKAKYQIAGVLISFFPEDDHIISRTAKLCNAHKLFLKRFSIKLDNVSEP